MRAIVLILSMVVIALAAVVYDLDRRVERIRKGTPTPYVTYPTNGSVTCSQDGSWWVYTEPYDSTSPWFIPVTTTEDEDVVSKKR